jgi:predicted nucleic acid-binding protein
LNHVFVETNFLVDLLRPFAGREAEALWGRRGKDVRLYVPWVSLAEAKRTLGRVVNEDLGFSEAMMTHAVRQLLAGSLSRPDHQVLLRFAEDAKSAQYNQQKAIERRVDEVAQDTNVVVIEPDKAVVEKTLNLFPVKSLPPFDEMVLGAVLVKAAEVNAGGASQLHFCNLNKKDFDPTNRPALAAEYSSCGLLYRSDFRIP